MSTDTEQIDVEPPAAMADALKRFVTIDHRRRELADEDKALGVEQARLSAQLLDQFADVGIQNARVDGLTVYVRHDRYVSKKADVSTEHVCQVLREIGLGYMVSDGYSPQSLKSKVLEYEKEETEVPAALAAVLSIGDVPRVATRKA